ncbi:hypothetical protein N7495_002839 [Penicillium taxi]|uniref:uncharacterized protein n=1 Tax=Penicillium taxi TaxID=168475 RepID=UPI002545B3E1|nr:uncharacterized protein N7495_002839 [Penicillium taxi]KAJ5902311.1 hypothetical protein N7495_002839 [Penicillium taxi]
MGLRKLFKGLRPSYRKDASQSTSPSPSVSTACINKNDTKTVVTSSQTLQSGACISDTNFTTKYSMHRDLWDEAYAALGREDPRLNQRYEEILLSQEDRNGKPTWNHLAPDGSYQREKQLRQIAESMVEELDLAQWQLRIGSHSVDVGGRFDKVVKIVVAAKEFVSSAVSSEPHAALAWAGVCIFLPLLLNPSEQKSAVHDGLEAIPFTVHRLRVMDRLIRPGNAGLTQIIYQNDSLELVKGFEDTTVELYKTILEFQIRIMRQCSDNWAKRYGRDVFKADDWTSLTSRIKTLELRCTEIAQDLSRERIEKALQLSEHNMQRGLQEVQQELEKTTCGIRQQTMMQSAWRQTDEERNCVQLFRKSNPYENQRNRTPKRVLETGKWFLENSKFLDWRENEGPDLLWLSAKPGSGKSVLAKTIIDESLATLSHQKRSVVCYFFFKDISPYQRSASSAISAILHQIFSVFPSLVKHALMPYDLNGKDLLHLFNEMFDILCKAAADSSIGQVVCVLDALDECSDDDQFLLIEAITNFYHEAKNTSNIDNQPKLKFLLTSRPYSHIHSHFHDLMKETPTIHLSGDHESEKIKDEIDLVIDTEIPKLAAERGFDKEATKYLLEELHEVENRTYLWLSLIMDEIRLSERPANKRELQKIISGLPRSLIDAYEGILKRCRHPDLARQILSIILAAREPLTVDDMKIATALASDFGYCSYEEIGIERSDAFEMRIKNACGLMVTIDDGSVFLIHQTAKDFLTEASGATRNSESWRHSFSPLDSEILLAKICITLLSFTYFSETPLTIDNGDDETHKLISEYTKNNPFLKYAAMNWMDHSHEAELDSNLDWMLSMVSLCSVNKPVFRTWYTIHQRLGTGWFPWKMTSLNITAEFDFPNVLASFLESGEDPNEPDGCGATPLARSVQKSKRAVALLLDANADINAQGWDEPWHYEIDDSGSEIEAKPFSGTPLVMAVLNEDLEMVKYLIKRGAKINFPSHNSLTPLYAACIQYIINDESESREVLSLLLRSGANVCFELREVDGQLGMTALHFAAEYGDPSILSILLSSETADVNFQLRKLSSNVLMKDNDPIKGQSSVDEPRSSSDQGTLSQNGFDSDSEKETSGSNKDKDSKADSEADYKALTPDNVSSPSFNRDSHKSDSSESIDLSQNYLVGATPLHLAARAGLVKNVKLLLEHGADPHIEDSDGYTVFDLVFRILPTVGIGDDNSSPLIKAQAEMTDSLAKYGQFSSDSEESLSGVTSTDG